MNVIRADFKKQPRPSKVLWSTCAVLAMVAAAGAVWTWREWAAAQGAERLLKNAIATAHSPPPSPVAAPPRPYDQSARRVLVERSIPWPQGLTTLEATTIVGVTPVSVDFGNSENAIRLEVSFVEYGGLLEYLNALNAGEPELHWRLAQSQASTANSSTAVLIGTWGRR